LTARGKKCLVIVIDGMGCGELPDADEYNDIGSNTIGNLAESLGGINLPNLARLGLGNIIPIKGMPPAEKPKAFFGKMAELSPAKDSTAGHWELMGHPVPKPFPTYPDGFPREIVSELENTSGYKFIGNKTASGTVIINELGDDHLKTGALILYTSADSVLQIAAHEKLVPLEHLYHVCEIARSIMTGEHAVGRIIARPFLGESGKFYRTPNRHDFSLQPNNTTVLDILMAKGIDTISIGKIFDLFGGKGISGNNPTKSNTEGIEKTIEVSVKIENGLIFVNLVDFDMLWGHRNDPEGFYRGLREFNAKLPGIMQTMSSGDLLIITADHGVDPTTLSTDHSREYVPVLCWKPELKYGGDLGVRKSFADVGATVADYFNVEDTGFGESFLNEVLL
jgi:phosphopentomutase